LKDLRKRPRRAEIVLDAVLLFLLTAAVIRPWFTTVYQNKWGSIESTFISDSRFLIEHWPHPRWQPLWFAGTRFDYIYPPAVRYGTAAIANAAGIPPIRAYRFYTGFFYCLGIAGVYLLIRAGTGMRGGAWLGAAATALVSPTFLVMSRYRIDSYLWGPQRLHVLVEYGEGPHVTAVALIPIALAFAWRALAERRPTALALAAVFAAAVVSNNFYGATSLAISYAALVWSFWVTRRGEKWFAYAVAIPVLAYGLTAFWLVPSYFRITLANMKYVAAPTNGWSIAVVIAGAAAFAWASYRLANGRPERTWGVFVAGLFGFFALDVLGDYFIGLHITGQAGRLVPELDLAAILGAITVLAVLWRRGGALRLAGAVVAFAGLATAAGYLQRPWQIFPPADDYRARVEYRIPEWLWHNMPEARTFPVGSVRFWLDAWRDLPELGGGSEQGVLNELTERANWNVRLSPNTELSVLWLQAMGVDAVYSYDDRSQEVFRGDYANPKKFDGVLPVIYDDQAGNRIYRVARRFPVLARVVEQQRLNALEPPTGNEDMRRVRAYVEAIEQGPPAAVILVREGSDALRVQAHIAPGESLVVQESYDPAWQAWCNGRRLPVRADAMGMMALDPPPGDPQIRLVFSMPLENRLGWFLTAATLAALLILLARSWRTAPA
jgi:hypothetical protein